MNLGETIKLYRRNRKTTLKELASKVSTTASFLSDIENNKKQPSIETLRRLSEAFDIPLFMLFKDTSEVINPIGEETIELDFKNKKIGYKDAFILQARALFLSDELSKTDKEAMYKNITDLYWEAKRIEK